MRKSFCCLFAGIFITSTGCSAVFQPKSAPGDNPVYLASQSEKSFKQVFDSHINPLISSGEVVGLSAGVIKGNIRQFFGYGTTKKGKKTVPNEKNIFHIASISKVFTSLVLADMAVKNEVRLDDSLQSLLPASVKVPEYKGEKITLKSLAMHMSGLPNQPDDLDKINFDPIDPYASYQVNNVYNFLSGYKLKQDNVKRQGFGHYEYSNLGSGLLGHALALKLKTNYETSIKTRISVPIGLKNTGITLSSEQKKLLLQGHFKYQGETYPMPFSHFTEPLAGGAALNSNTEDLLKFVEANIGHIKTPLSQAMELSHREGYPESGIALGWHTAKTSQGKQIIWHNGAWTASGFSGFIGFVKDSGTGVVLLSNTYNKSILEVGFKILDQLGN